MSNKILTAEDYCNQTGNGNIEGGWENSDQYEQVKKLMVEFAKLHVESALQAASEKVIANHQECWGQRTGEIEIDKDSIINSYPLTNIR